MGRLGEPRLDVLKAHLLKQALAMVMAFVLAEVNVEAKLRSLDGPSRNLVAVEASPKLTWQLLGNILGISLMLPPKKNSNVAF